MPLLDALTATVCFGSAFSFAPAVKSTAEQSQNKGD
jgi:hypothetical protein